jgi:hypothetical protein
MSENQASPSDESTLTPSLLFVDESSQYGQRKDPRAKAHTARINWSRYKRKTRGQPVPSRSRATQKLVDYQPAVDRSSKTAENDHLGEVDESLETWTVPRNLPEGVGEPDAEVQDLAIAKRVDSRLSTPLISSVSPVFGALAVQAFPLEDSADIADVANYSTSC